MKKQHKRIPVNRVVIILSVIMLAFVITKIGNNSKNTGDNPDNTFETADRASHAPAQKQTPDNSQSGTLPAPDTDPGSSQSETMSASDGPQDETLQASDSPQSETLPLPAPAPNPLPLNTAVTNISDTDIELADTLDAIAKKYNCAGVTLSSYDPQRGYFIYQYGYADLETKRTVEPETKFRVASLTKIVTMMLIMTLVDDGMLDIDDDVSDYLGINLRHPDYPDTIITSRMLLQHTSSLYDSGAYNSGDISFNDNTIRELLNSSSIFQDRQPGTEHEYSDLGYILLGSVCENVSEKKFDSLAREKIFTPLGIDAALDASKLENKNVASQYNASHTLRRSAARQIEASSSGPQYRFAVGNLVITALDYAKILNILTHDGVYGDVRILSSQSMQEIYTADVQGNYDYMQGLSVRFIGDWIFGENIYYHTGSAYGTLAQFIYSLNTGQIAVVVTTGSNSQRSDFNSIDVCTEMSAIIFES